MDQLRLFKIHVFYIVSFLLLCLVISLTVEWGKIPDLVSYIGFALSFTSLILSIFAIFQGLLSSSSLHESISLIQDASQKVVSNAEKIDAATRAMSEQVKDVPGLMTGVRDELRSHTEAIQRNPSGKSLESEVLSEKFVNSFISNSSILGLISLYIAQKSLELKIPFSLSEISANNPFLEYGYCYAYLTASTSADLLEYKNPHGQWTIIAMNNVLLQKLIPKLQELIRMKEEDGQKLFQGGIDSIDAYFSDNGPKTDKT